MLNTHRRALPLRSWSAGGLLTLLLSACAEPQGAVAPVTPGTPLTWTARASSPTPLYEGQGAAVGGRLYVFGGFDRNLDGTPTATRAAHVYDPAADRWAALRTVPDALTHAGVAVDGSFIYLAGGFLGDHPGPQTDHVWRYDTSADTWTALPPLPGARGGGALVRLGRALHFFGGTERTADGTYRRDHGTHWRLSLDAPTAWQTRAPLPNPRNHLGGAVLGGQIYAVGGQHLGDEADGAVADVHRYDPASDSWTAAAPLPRPLGHITASTVVWDNRIVVLGGVALARTPGQIEGQESDQVLAYDPDTDRWSRLAPLPGPRQSPVADAIGGELIVSAGSTAAGPVDSTLVGR